MLKRYSEPRRVTNLNQLMVLPGTLPSEAQLKRAARIEAELKRLKTQLAQILERIR